MPCRDPIDDNWYSEQLATLTNMLCGICTRIEEEDRAGVIHTDQTLSKWWMAHKENDAKRKALEEAEETRKNLAKVARLKLTQAERDALGIR